MANVRVRATKAGYGGDPVDRRKIGDEFDAPEGKASWYVPVNEAKAPLPAVKQEPQTLSEFAKLAAPPVPEAHQDTLAQGGRSIGADLV